MKKLILSMALCAAFNVRSDIPSATPVPRDAEWMARNANWTNRHEQLCRLAKEGGAPIVFIGDWTTEHWTHPDRGGRIWDRFFKEGATKGLNLGVYADCTEQMIWRVEHGELDGFEAKLVVIAAGGNNLVQRPFDSEPPVDTQIGIKTLIDAVRRKQPKAKVLLHPIFPCESEAQQRRADAVNADLWKFCDGVNVFWCDFNDRLTTVDGRCPVTIFDGLFHTTGHEIWAAEILPYARAAVAGTEMPPSRFATRLPPSTTGFGRAAATVTPMTGSNYVEFWYPRLRQHRREIVENPTKRFDLVFCGDSITHLWEEYGKEVYAEITNRFSVLNLGYCGNNIQHLLWRLKNGEGQGYKAKLFMVMIGTNNPSDSAKAVADGTLNLVKTIHEIHPESKVLMLPIFPRGEKAGNFYRTKNAESSELVRQALADDKAVIWLDFNERFLQPDGTLPKAMFGDFLHPNKDGYRIWCDAVMPVFEKYGK